MIRLVLVAFVVIVLVVVALRYAAQSYLQRHRQKQLARYAPELLEYHDIPGPVAAVIVTQGIQLDEIHRLIQALLTDEVVLIPTEYADPLEAWLAKQPKRRLTS